MIMLCKSEIQFVFGDDMSFTVPLVLHVSNVTLTVYQNEAHKSDRLSSADVEFVSLGF